MGPKAWTRRWTTMRRECGARTSSRASRRPWPSTRPAAGARSSCQMRARCTVSAWGGQSGRGPARWPRPLLSVPCQTGWLGEPWPPARRASPGGLELRVSGASSSCTSAPRKQAGRSPHAPRLSPALPAGGFGVTQGARKTGSVQRATERLWPSEAAPDSPDSQHPGLRGCHREK